MSWNFRVIKQKDKNIEIYKIAEVFYDDNGDIYGWVDCADSILMWDNYDDLEGTVHLILNAFKRPVLVVQDDGTLKEEYVKRRRGK